MAIVLDCSGSVDNDEWDLEVAGAKAILDALDPDKDGQLSSPVAIVQFSSSAVITASLSQNRAQVEAGLTRTASDLTYYDLALTKALEALAPSSDADSVAELVLFFSDGAPSSGSYTPARPGRPPGPVQTQGHCHEHIRNRVRRERQHPDRDGQTTDGAYTAIPDFADVSKVASSLPGVVGLSSVKIDTNNDGVGDINASVGVDGSWTASVPIHLRTEPADRHRHRNGCQPVSRHSRDYRLRPVQSARRDHSR